MKSKKVNIFINVLLGTILVISATILWLSAANLFDMSIYGRSQMKFFLFGSTNLILAKILAKILTDKKWWKYIIVAVLNLLITCAVFVVNNLLNYRDMVLNISDMGGYTLFDLMKADFNYSMGNGFHRYILFFIIGIAAFVCIERGLVRFLWNFVAKIADTSVETLYALFDKIGIWTVWGLSYSSEIDDGEREELIKKLKNYEEISLMKKVDDDETTYVIIFDEEDNDD